MFILEENFSNHSLSVNERNSVDMTGVTEVISFDDVTVNIKTNMGKLSVKGEKLHITVFDENIGLLKISGYIHGIIYLSESKSSGGFISKLLK